MQSLPVLRAAVLRWANVSFQTKTQGHYTPASWSPTDLGASPLHSLLEAFVAATMGDTECLPRQASHLHLGTVAVGYIVLSPLDR